MEVIQKVYNESKAISKAIRIGSLFISKEKRNELAAKCKKEGYIVKKSNVRNQQLHPEYIEDYEGQIEIGFGNSDYRRYWQVLYKLVCR